MTAPCRWLQRAILLTCLSLAGCDAPGRPDPADRPLRPSEIMEFETLFAQNCAGCHGADGTLGPAPPVNDPLFRAGITVEELTNLIVHGRPQTLMPGCGGGDIPGLTTAQIKVLVYGIKGIPYRVSSRTLENGQLEFSVEESPDGNVSAWGLPGRAPPEMPPLYDPLAAMDASAERGVELFARACANCHNVERTLDANGGGRSRATAGQCAGSGDIDDPAFLALISDRALRRLIITGRPDLGMPNYAGTDGRDAEFNPLTTQQIADLVALLASWRINPSHAQP